MEPEKFKKLIGRDTPDDVRWDTKKWRRIEEIKLKQEIDKMDLMTDRMVAETFREMFMKYNKPWI